MDIKEIINQRYAMPDASLDRCTTLEKVEWICTVSLRLVE